MGGKKYLKCLL